MLPTKLNESKNCKRKLKQQIQRSSSRSKGSGSGSGSTRSCARKHGCQPRESESVGKQRARLARMRECDCASECVCLCECMLFYALSFAIVTAALAVKTIKAFCYCLFLCPTQMLNSAHSSLLFPLCRFLTAARAYRNEIEIQKCKQK